MNVWISDYLGTYVLPDFVKRFNDKYPEESLHIYNGNDVELKNNLLQKSDQLCHYPLYETDDYILSDYEFEPLFVENLLLVASQEIRFKVKQNPHAVHNYEDKSICIIRKYEVKLFKT